MGDDGIVFPDQTTSTKAEESAGSILGLRNWWNAGRLLLEAPTVGRVAQRWHCGDWGRSRFHSPLENFYFPNCQRYILPIENFRFLICQRFLLPLESVYFLLLKAFTLSVARVPGKSCERPLWKLQRSGVWRQGRSLRRGDSDCVIIAVPLSPILSSFLNQALRSTAELTKVWEERGYPSCKKDSCTADEKTQAWRLCNTIK